MLNFTSVFYLLTLFVADVVVDDIHHISRWLKLFLSWMKTRESENSLSIFKMKNVDLLLQFPRSSLASRIVVVKDKEKKDSSDSFAVVISAKA